MGRAALRERARWIGRRLLGDWQVHLALAILVGLVLRVSFAAVKRGIFFPDELFQYLEPAYWRLHGYGALFEEYQRGMRHWLLPTLYGGVIGAGELIGLHGWELHRFIQYNNAILCVLVVPVSFRLGQAVGGRDVGLLTAWMVALFPWLAYLAPNTLSENPSMIVVTLALALWLESRDAPAAARNLRLLTCGALLGVCFLFRYAMVFWIVPVALDLVVRRQGKALVVLSVGALATLCVGGAIDAVTLGAPFASLIEFVRFHMVDEAGSHGHSPAPFYLTDGLWGALGVATIPLVLVMLPIARQQWPIIVAWLVPLAFMSSFVHKEERFIIPLWPTFCAAAAAGLVFLHAWARTRLTDTKRVVVFLALGALVLALAALPVVNWPMNLSAGTFRAQTFVGKQGDSTGVLVDGVAWFDGPRGRWIRGDYQPWFHGGHLLLTRGMPLAQFDEKLLDHRLFNYIIVRDPKNLRRLEGHPAFQRVATFEHDVQVFRRQTTR